MDHQLHVLAHGWLIAARVGDPAGREHQVMFAAALSDEAAAVAMVDAALSNGPWSIAALCRLSPRALMRLRAKPGAVALLAAPHVSAGRVSAPEIRQLAAPTTSSRDCRTRGPRAGTSG